MAPVPMGPVVPATPEQAKKYCENHEFYWLSPNRRSYTGKDHAAILIEHPYLFGFTKEELARAQEPVVNPQEMVDRYLRLYEIAIERDWICILVSKIAAAVGIDLIPFAHFWFKFETPEVYDRITDWLKSKGVRNGIITLKDIMLRSWTQPVQSMYARAQFSKGGKKPTCQVCGYEIGTEELIMRGQCPRCTTKLW